VVPLFSMEESINAAGFTSREYPTAGQDHYLGVQSGNRLRRLGPFSTGHVEGAKT
jgi:hypothetical protein